MPKHITTFGGFLRQVLLLVLVVVVVLGILSIPAYFLLKQDLGIDLLVLAREAITDPMKVVNFMIARTQNEPTKSLFLFTTFPGFTFAAVFSTIFMIWVERKLVAKIQLRVGPSTRAASRESSRTSPTSSNSSSRR